MSSKIALVDVDSKFEPALLSQLQQLPECEIFDGMAMPEKNSAPLELRMEQGRLKITHRLAGSNIFISFMEKDLIRRVRPANVKSEMVVRAVVGRQKKIGLQVLDATAGLARDGLLLAAAGCEVTLVERIPVLAILLQRAIEQAQAGDDAGLAAAAIRMSCLQANSLDVLHTLQQKGAQAPEVIYLDPMYQPHPGQAVAGLKPSAAVNKHMATLQLLGRLAAEHYPQLQKADDSDHLFELAIACARSKVVVKRAPKAPWLAHQKPSSTIAGKAARFDIYAC